MVAPPLPRKDWLILGLLGFFLLVACTLELYWVLYTDQLVERSQTDLIAYGFRFYGEADSAYYDHVTPLSLGLETLNVFVTQWLNLWLAYAILKRKPYRYALQLTLGAYLTYSLVLYFWTAHLSGYAGMQERSFYSFFMFVAPNLPWLVGYLYLGCDAFRAITQRYRESPATRAPGDLARERVEEPSGIRTAYPLRQGVGGER